MERAELTSLASRRSTAQALALRARIILACADGEQSKVVAARLAVDPDTVGEWLRRFAERRLEGLWDEPRSGAPRTIEDARIEAVIVRTLEIKPPDATHWSSRGMARAGGLSVSTVQRIWRAFGLQPHRLETFKLSTDPEFVARVRDVARSKEVMRIPVGKAPVQVSFTPDGGRAYVSLRDENNVAVIDTAQRKKIATVAVGRNPIQVFATPDGHDIYVANQGSEANPDKHRVGDRYNQ